MKTFTLEEEKPIPLGMLGIRGTGIDYFDLPTLADAIRNMLPEGVISELDRLQGMEEKTGPGFYELMDQGIMVPFNYRKCQDRSMEFYLI
jgi:hypothetical protein